MGESREGRKVFFRVGFLHIKKTQKTVKRRGGGEEKEVFLSLVFRFVKKKEERKLWRGFFF